jgi:hypothetical protein
MPDPNAVPEERTVSDETPEERARTYHRKWGRSALAPAQDGLALARDVLALSAEKADAPSSAIRATEEALRLRAEVNRLRHGEKVRDGMLDMFRSGYELDRHRGAWVRVIVSYGDAEQEGHRLTPDEIAVLAALDTEEDA